jgi:hypothetical protein
MITANIELPGGGRYRPRGVTDELTSRVKYMDIPDLHARALRAEPKLRPIEVLVDTLCATAPSKRSGLPMCYNCVWSQIVRPLTLRLVGDSRGEPVEMPPDEIPDSWQPVDLSTWLSEDPDDDAPPLSEIEAWLNTSEAWNAVVRPWKRKLEAADPGNGHGLPQQGVPA